MKVVVGTRNAHKIAELSRILGPALPGLELVPAQGPAPEETGNSFYANALIKARAAHEITGMPAIADDSGIEVDALDGAPGVYSARFSPSGLDGDNVALLLAKMEGRHNRRAAFVCAAAYVASGAEYVIERRWEGSVASAPSGEGGFGYDPVFIPEGMSHAAAALTAEEKDTLSHRGQAFRALARLMPVQS
ncbi:MAG: XTP/dITP diphosphohydrolase [Pontimonas sp.]